MNQLLQALYRYAVDHTLEAYLLEERETLDENTAMRTVAQARLEGSLSPLLREAFDNYAWACALESDLRAEAGFAAGLSLGLSLARL